MTHLLVLALYGGFVVAGIAVSYVIIRFAVKHGVSSALREHEAWNRLGGGERMGRIAVTQDEAWARVREEQERNGGTSSP